MVLLDFNCVVIDDRDSPLFVLEMDENAKILNLKERIYEYKEYVFTENRVSKGDLKLYVPKYLLISPENDLAERSLESLSSAEVYLDFIRVSKIWSGNIEEKVHVVAVGRKHGPVKKSDLDGNIISRRFKAIRLGKDAMTPSDAAKPSSFPSEQEGHPVYNGRPDKHRGPSIALYNSAFARLKDNLDKMHTFDLSPNELTTTFRFMKAAVKIYTNEKEREKSILGLLQELLGCQIGLKRLRTSKAEGDGVIQVGKAGWLAAIGYWELKNELGSQGIADYQAVCTYRKHIVEDEYIKIRASTCCPCLIISMIGPYISIQGAIFIDAPVLQPFTDYVFLGGEPEYEDRLLKVARIFHASRKALADLEHFYEKVDYSEELKPEALLPKPTPINENVSLPDIRFIDRLFKNDMARPIYLANMARQDVIVKFVRQYCEDAHKLLARHGLAPRLHFCAPVLGGYWMVVMEHIHGVDGHSFLKEHGFSQDVYDDVKRAIEVLHRKGYVFGDLRPQNIMVVTGEPHSRASLVDFDWCGKDSEARYPSTLNTDLDWAAGVVPLGLMKKEHDNYLLLMLSEF
ncbi:hypothetical protein ACEPAG_2817 [Sanghuangporus baumii]